jgi:hypothetical protein
MMTRMRGAFALLVALAACPGPDGSTSAPSGSRRSPLDATAIEAALAAYDLGGDALLDRLADDAWLVHHGTTSARGREAIAAYLRDLHRAFPQRDLVTRTPVRIGEDAWLVELDQYAQRRIPSAQLVALVRTERNAIASIEVFGADPRELPEVFGDPLIEPGAAPLQLESSASPAVSALVPSVEALSQERAGAPRLRLSASGGDLVFAVFVLELATDQGPMTRHVAALARVEDGRVASARLYANPRDGGPAEMGNLFGDRMELQSRVEADALVWGGWLGFCCEQGSRTRSCRRTSTRALAGCRTSGGLALVCREAYHCTGAECFCCASGLDAACSMDHVPDEEIVIPKGRRPPEPSIWSPY